MGCLQAKEKDSKFDPPFELQQKGEEESSRSAGLENLGNTSYLNACCQMLFAIPGFRQALSRIELSHEEALEKAQTTQSSVDKSGLLAVALRDLFQEMCAATGDPVCPSKLLQALHLYDPYFAEKDDNGRLQPRDLRRCWTCLLDALNAALCSVENSFICDNFQCKCLGSKNSKERMATVAGLELGAEVGLEDGIPKAMLQWRCRCLHLPPYLVFHLARPTGEDMWPEILRRLILTTALDAGKFYVSERGGEYEMGGVVMAGPLEDNQQHATAAIRSPDGTVLIYDDDHPVRAEMAPDSDGDLFLNSESAIFIYKWCRFQVQL